MTESISKQNKRRMRSKSHNSTNQIESPELGLLWVKDTLSKAVWFPTTKTKFNKIVSRLNAEKRTFTTSKI